MNRNVYYTYDFEVYYFMSPPLFRNENRMKLVEAEHSGKLEKVTYNLAYGIILELVWILV